MSEQKISFWCRAIFHKKKKTFKSDCKIFKEQFIASIWKNEKRHPRQISFHYWKIYDILKVTKRATYQAAGELTYRCRKCTAKRIISIEKLAYPKVGTSYTISGNEYKVSKPGAEVILVKTSKTTKNVTVPAQIYAQGITYKVTSIGAKAFNNNKNLTKVTIGTNIVKINRNAFFNCKNLKTVIIKSVRLTGKTANKKAFKNAHKKLVIRVPKKVKKIYKKIFKGLKVK